MAIVLSDELDKKVNKLKVLKMVLIHDLAEAVTGDIPSFELSERQNEKHSNEEKALKHIISSLPVRLQKEIMFLWNEFENCQTQEAKFANSIDKIEVCIQHNLANISTWDDGDYKVGPYYKNYFFDFDPFMRSFKDKVDLDTMQKVMDNKQSHRVSAENLKRFRKQQKH